MPCHRVSAIFELYDTFSRLLQVVIFPVIYDRYAMNEANCHVLFWGQKYNTSEHMNVPTDRCFGHCLSPLISFVNPSSVIRSPPSYTMRGREKFGSPDLKVRKSVIRCPMGSVSIVL